MKSLIIFGVLLTAFAASAFSAGLSKEELARIAASGDEAASKAAIAELRAMGPKGLDAMVGQYAAEIERYSATGESSPEWTRIANAIDTVAMQKDAYASGLYWFTDLEKAKDEADSRNRPILSLRLLGNLNEEFSCANSRLFRSLLYANADLAKYLRENYVLHWRSVRPAPRITIDFGDGRKIERTITGNSIHYILDESGVVIDALPGLYSPKAFAIYLAQAYEVNKVIDGLTEPDREKAVKKFRKISFDRITDRRANAVALTKVKRDEPPPLLVYNDKGEAVPALVAAPVAAAKMVVVDENSLLRVYDDFARFAPQMDFGDWQKLATVYSKENGVDAASRAFIMRQNRLSGRSQAEYDAMFKRLNEFISIDTTRNDFLYRTQVYELLNRPRGPELELLNDMIYARIFKTPSSDEWLGLYSPDVYAALDGNGLVK